MNKLFRILKNIFLNGKTLRNGRKILPNATKLNRIIQFEKLLNADASGKMKVRLKINFSEKQQIQLLNQIQTGKLTPEQAILKINRKNYYNFMEEVSNLEHQYRDIRPYNIMSKENFKADMIKIHSKYGYKLDTKKLDIMSMSGASNSPLDKQGRWPDWKDWGHTIR